MGLSRLYEVIDVSLHLWSRVPPPRATPNKEWQALLTLVVMYICSLSLEGRNENVKGRSHKFYNFVTDRNHFESD